MLQFVRGSAGASGSKQAAGADGLPGHDCKGERQIQVTSVGRGRWSSIRMDAPGRVCMRNVSLISKNCILKCQLYGTQLFFSGNPGSPYN